MVHISTFVFFDLETTGLPYQERNRTKITELCFVAVNRKDMRYNKHSPQNIRQISKLSFVFNPDKSIQPASASITGLTNEVLKYAPTFKKRFNSIKSFLEDLEKPVCLVAHNGNIFDYKILLAECVDANEILPIDLLCVDSLHGFKKLLTKINISVSEEFDESILTDDSEGDKDWPDLNITPEEYKEIDELSSSFTELRCQNSPIIKNSKKVKTTKSKAKAKSESYKLTDIYKRLFNKEPENAHRAEYDCLMLLECVVACQDKSIATDDFLHWIDENCKKLNDIAPLIRK